MVLQNIKNERGMVLVTSLALLLILTLLGISAMQTTTLEERMSGNISDRNIAFQAAEAALRDAEDEIFRELRFMNAYNGQPTDPVDTRRQVLIADGPFTSACTNGLCYNTANLTLANWDATRMSAVAGNGVTYGSITGRAPLAGVAAQPRYVIDFECFPVVGESLGVYVFTITALAVGANPTTTVMLEASYRVK
jgi:type IV pilus assembly protein PilX